MHGENLERDETIDEPLLGILSVTVCLKRMLKVLKKLKSAIGNKNSGI